MPLRALGLGSSRLLIAALQRKAAENVTTFLIDELEYGLEPHRIIRLLGALGAKEERPPLQVFATSHSPIAVTELSAHQLHIVRRNGVQHRVTRASDAGDVQGTIRAHAHALLASSIVVCEGGSEIGLICGLDQHFTASGETSLSACGATLVNRNGDETFTRALAWQFLDTGPPSSEKRQTRPQWPRPPSLATGARYSHGAVGGRSNKNYSRLSPTGLQANSWILPLRRKIAR